MSAPPKNEDYTTGNFLDFSDHRNCFKLVGIDLLKQTNMNIPQQINFTGKLEEDDDNNVFYCWKVAINNSKLFFRCINCNRII